MPSLDQLLKLQADGNQKDAYDGLRRFVLEKKDASSADLVKAFNAAIDLPAAAQSHRRDRRVSRESRRSPQERLAGCCMAVAQSYLTFDHYGYMIAGEFSRGQHRGGGKVVHATARDRVRALQLYRSAMKARQNGKRQERPGRNAPPIRPGNDLRQRRPWRLQSLTDLDKLPDYEEGWYYGGEQQGAPVDADGNPVFYAIPKTWDAAKNDGERWRWLLETMVEWQPSRRNDERMDRAQLPRIAIRRADDGPVRLRAARTQETDADKDKKDSKTGIWALDTLGEDETIARLATGVKRFKLPDDTTTSSSISRCWQTHQPKQPDGLGLDAARSLALLFENRRQYPRAAEYWRQAIERSTGDARNDVRAAAQSNRRQLGPVRKRR